MLGQIRDRVLVEIEELPEKSEGGLWIPQTAERRDQVGTVAAVGPEVTELKVGDRVVYNVYSQMVEHGGKKYRVVKEENVLARIDGALDVHTGKKKEKGKVAWQNLD